MKAIVLAAGKGERLRSVVGHLPKPMIEVNGRPILEQNIVWLKNSGIDEIYINLHHLPDVIRSHFGDGSRWKVKIRYSHEPKLLGTSGAVREIMSRFWSRDVAEPFIVAYGDNLLTDFDLAATTAFHATQNGIGTVCLHRRDDVLQSGIVILDDDGRIVRFIEKPSPEQAVSNLVNAGLYVLAPDILQYIREGFSDFGRDVFPAVLDAGRRLYGITCEANLVAVDTPQLLNKALTGSGAK